MCTSSVTQSLVTRGRFLEMRIPDGSRQRGGEDGSPARPVHPPLLAQLPRHPSSPWTAPDPGRGQVPPDRAAELPGRQSWPVPDGHPSASRLPHSRPGRATASESASTVSIRNCGACAESTSRCCSGENPSVSPGCGARFSTTNRCGCGSDQGICDVGQHQVRQHTGEPGARTKNHQVSLLDGGDRLGAARRVRRIDSHRSNSTGGRGDGHLAPNSTHQRSVVFQPFDLGDDV